jgi:FdhD protein
LGPAVPSPSLHWSGAQGVSAVSETLAVEAPLAVEVAYERSGQKIRKVLGVTMRTPGHDEELALGFLHGEGLITGCDDVRESSARASNARGEKMATWGVELVHPPREDLGRISRSLVTSSACGLCGRSTLEGLPLRRVAPRRDQPAYSPAMIAALPEALRRLQPTFALTGGCHGAALCDERGSPLLVREDVGRHNAVDKLVGAALLGGISCTERILVLSGRGSFELLQKAAVAGVALVVAVGAPSSLAVDMARAAGITLIGFTRENRFNIYTHAARLDLAAGQPGHAAAVATAPFVEVSA